MRRKFVCRSSFLKECAFNFVADEPGASVSEGAAGKVKWNVAPRPPIENTKGGLGLYHAVRHTASRSIYRLGLALFDLE